MGTGKVLALALVVLTGCDMMDLNVYRCHDPDKGHKDANGEPDPCHRNDPPASDAGPSNDAGEACTGLCLPLPQTDWEGPMLIWMGADEADAPPCPSVAPSQGFTGRSVIVPEVCSTCGCERPSGSCELPATLTAASAVCSDDDPGVTDTSFFPPPGWDGTCTSVNAIPAAKDCGGVPCVQSVTIAPLTIKQTGCKPIETPHVPAPPSWGMFARTCTTGHPLPDSCTAVETCVPASPGPEFKQCVALLYPFPDDVTCSPDYPNRSVITQNTEFVDERTCAPCSCSAPDGSTCTGSISVFEDSTCKAPQVFENFSIDATGPKCLDLVPGAALGSKSASKPIYMPGTCKPSRGTLGYIHFTQPRVICCQGTP